MKTTPSRKKMPAKKAAKKAARRPPIGERALAAAQEALAYMRGEPTPGLVVHHPVDAKAVREKTGLSQAAFAETFGLSAATVRDWEQNRKTPERMAQTLLKVIDTAPEVVKRVVKSA